MRPAGGREVAGVRCRPVEVDSIMDVEGAEDRGRSPAVECGCPRGRIFIMGGEGAETVMPVESARGVVAEQDDGLPCGT